MTDTLSEELLPGPKPDAAVSGAVEDTSQAPVSRAELQKTERMILDLSKKIDQGLAANRQSASDVIKAEVSRASKDQKDFLITRLAGLLPKDGPSLESLEREARLDALQRTETMNAVSAAITGKALLREAEIAKAALPWGEVKASGVYFLLEGEKVVYIGQSVNVYARIHQHTDKRFDRYAFVPCAVDALDKLESLYIHCLRPPLNGNQVDGFKCAPISLNALICMKHS